MTPQGKQVLGIIAEYNPFHNGHLYHIQEAKRLSGCDYLIVVMRKQELTPCWNCLSP